MALEARQQDDAPGITQGEFERFRDYFYRKTGIYFDDSKRYYVDKRILERMEATGHRDFRSYFNFLRFQASGQEFQELVNRMTVNETYFFREKYQLDCLVDGVLDEVLEFRQAAEPVRIWSIPCSTGEEPYSIGIYLLEHWPAIDEVDVEIVGSDIDTRALERARAGVFGRRSVQNLPPLVLGRYFTPTEDGGYRICDDLREAIDFCRVNLMNPAETKRFRNFDVVFCRNLLIYFDDAARRQAAQALYDAMRPGGFLFLGHSESMSRISSLFRVRRFGDTIVYQKPRR